jgi:hypothetical protein
MNWVVWGMMLTLFGTLLGCVVESRPPPRPPTPVREPYITCTPPHYMAILDLRVIPDPVRAGQPIEAWRITLQSDRNGECSTAIEIRDHDQVVGTGVLQAIRPGRGAYTLPANPHYRFQRQDSCYVVLANIGGSYAALDARRSFCATPFPGGGWTLRGR